MAAASRCASIDVGDVAKLLTSDRGQIVKRLLCMDANHSLRWYRKALGESRAWMSCSTAHTCPKG